VASTESEQSSALALGGLALATWSLILTLNAKDPPVVDAVAGQLLLVGAALTLVGPLLVPGTGRISGFFVTYISRSLGFGAIVLSISPIISSQFHGTVADVLSWSLVGLFGLGELHRVVVLARSLPGYFPGTPASTPTPAPAPTAAEAAAAASAAATEAATTAAAAATTAAQTAETAAKAAEAAAAAVKTAAKTAETAAAAAAAAGTEKPGTG
jgi:pyruvate/2-oxoglutarate dehydrogenase complex dihydrolipoamide acyltransferase (E2) component